MLLTNLWQQSKGKKHSSKVARTSILRLWMVTALVVEGKVEEGRRMIRRRFWWIKKRRIKRIQRRRRRENEDGEGPGHLWFDIRQWQSVSG